MGIHLLTAKNICPPVTMYFSEREQDIIDKSARPLSKAFEIAMKRIEEQIYGPRETREPGVKVELPPYFPAGWTETSGEDYVPIMAIS